MKRLLVLGLLLVSTAVFAFQDNPANVQESRPVNFWWWIIGVVISIGLGLAVYFMIKKNPKKDVPD